jgi:hypothetical protein
VIVKVRKRFQMKEKVQRKSQKNPLSQKARLHIPRIFQKIAAPGAALAKFQIRPSKRLKL